MVNVLVCLGSSSGRGHCVVFSGKALNSHSTCLSKCINGFTLTVPVYASVQMDTGKFNSGR